MSHLSFLSPGKSSAAALVLAALVVSACSRSSTELCSSGLVCPSGLECSADGLACILHDSCGDGTRQESEACDDGNLQSGDGCDSKCSSTEECGNDVLDPDEACDDGNVLNGDNCSFDCLHSAECGNHNIDANEECDPPGEREGFRCDQSCRIALCGNGKLDADEECDDGNSSNEDSCLTACKTNTCGDGYRDPQREACDDGNVSAESTCAYGTRDCTACNADCTAEVTLSGSFCGDGRKDAGEACDHGSANGSRTCRYGLRECSVCDATCSAEEAGIGSYCGDGVLNADFEQCDRGELACGTCSSQCRDIEPAKATGKIKVIDPGDIEPGQIVVISDGLKLPLTLLFTDDEDECAGPVICQPTHGNEQLLCCIRLEHDQTAANLAGRIKRAINLMNEQQWGDDFDVAATINESKDAALVALINDSHGSAGNQKILTKVSPNAMRIEGMSGGAAFDCPRNAPCVDDEDCSWPALECKSNHLCGPRW